MKIALVVPARSREGEKGFYDYRFYPTFLLSKKYILYPLSIPTLAALTPPGHEVRVFDENIEAIDYSWDADLAGDHGPHYVCRESLRDIGSVS